MVQNTKLYNQKLNEMSSTDKLQSLGVSLHWCGPPTATVPQGVPILVWAAHGCHPSGCAFPGTACLFPRVCLQLYLLQSVSPCITYPSQCYHPLLSCLSGSAILWHSGLLPCSLPQTPLSSTGTCCSDRCLKNTRCGGL